MRILLSNDDSLSSPFLSATAKALSKIGEVLIVVPQSEQSWIGRAYSRHKKLTLKRVDFLDFDCHTIDGTPADCVNIALNHIYKDSQPDIVVSGMNIGHNTGFPLLLSSGTFAAAVEGASQNILSFALSKHLDNKHYESCRLRHENIPTELEVTLKNACNHATSFIKKIAEENSTKSNCIYNLNYPSEFDLSNEFKLCKTANVETPSFYKQNPDGTFEFQYAIGKVLDKELTDLYCMQNNIACYSKINLYDLL